MPSSIDPSHPPRSNVALTALIAALYCLPAIIGLRPIVDLDIWWHLHQAAWIVEHGTLPLTDPFTSYGLGRSWIAYSWLYELFVYILYRGFGLLGVALYITVLAYAITIALHSLLRRHIDDVLAAGLTALALAAMYPVITQPRPWLVNVLFVIIELTVLLEVRRSGRQRPLWLLPPLFLVWACVNIQFIYGLFILVAAVVEAGTQRWIGSRLFDTRGFRLKPLLVTLGTCVLATCLTPYHVKIYVPVVTAIRLTDPFLFLEELQAPPFRLIYDWIALALLLSAVFALGRQRMLPLFLLLLLTAASFAAFRARRDVWFMAIVSVTILAIAGGRHVLERVRLGTARKMLIAVVVAATLTGLVMTRTSTSRLDREVAQTFPVAAASFIEKQGYRGRIYNDYNWGGYLMSRLPRMDVSLDGRNPVHGDARIWASMRTFAGHPGWASDRELSAADVVVVNSGAALASLLRHDARFLLAYEDAVALVFIPRKS